MHSYIALVAVLRFTPPLSIVPGLQTSECIIAPAKELAPVDQVQLVATLSPDDFGYHESKGETTTSDFGQLVQEMADCAVPIEISHHDWCAPPENHNRG